MAEAEKLLAYIERGFGHLSRPRQLAAENRDYIVNVVVADECPAPGITSYSTFGLSNYELSGRRGAVPFRVELLAACASQFDFAPVLANAAAFFIDNRELYGPGTVLDDAVVGSGAMWTGLRHLYVYRANHWNHGFEIVSLSEYDVRFLSVIPISDAESRAREERGAVAFEELLSASKVDLHDPLRKSVV